MRGDRIAAVTVAAIVGVAALVALAGLGCVKPTVLQQAMSLARRHREAEAVVLVRAQLAKAPDDVEARAMLVRLLAFTGDMGAAQREADELTKHLPPGDPRAWIELGHAREIAHDFEGALAAYDTAAGTAPASPAGPLEGGTRAARWGEVEEAAPRLEEAIERGANDAETWHTLGLVRVNLNDLGRGRERLPERARGGSEERRVLAGARDRRGEAGRRGGGAPGLRRDPRPAPPLRPRGARSRVGAREARAEGGRAGRARSRRGARCPLRERGQAAGGARGSMTVPS